MEAAADIPAQLFEAQRRGEWELAMQSFGVQAGVDSLCRRRRAQSGSPQGKASLRVRWADGGGEAAEEGQGQRGQQRPTRREQWELPMQVFGVDADIDALCSRRHIQAPCSRATRAEIGRRAAMHGDIEDVIRRRRVPIPGKDGAAVGQLVQGEAEPLSSPPLLSRQRSGYILPLDSETYDLPTSGHKNRKYFDGTVRAKCYAELIGRSTAPDDRSPERGPNGADDKGLPLALRRVLSATMPSGLVDEARVKLEAKVRQRLSKCLHRRGGSDERRKRSPEQYRSTQPAQEQQQEQLPHLLHSPPQQQQEQLPHLLYSPPQSKHVPGAGEAAAPCVLRGGGGRPRADYAAEDSPLPATPPRLPDNEQARVCPGESPPGPDGWDPNAWEPESFEPSLVDVSNGDRYFAPLLEIPEELADDDDRVSAEEAEAGALAEYQETLSDVEESSGIIGIEEQYLFLQQGMLAAAREAALEAMRGSNGASAADGAMCNPTLLTSRTRQQSRSPLRGREQCEIDDLDKVGAECEGTTIEG